jgi:hypothetical protein
LNLESPGIRKFRDSHGRRSINSLSLFPLFPQGLVKAPDLYLPEFPGVLEDIKDSFADFVVAPLVGGISKYGVTKRFDLLARDASCQAEKRIRNTQVYSAGSAVGSVAYNADVSDTQRLIRQAKEAIVDANAKSEVDDDTASLAQSKLDSASDELDVDDLLSAIADLGAACSLLTQ